MSIDAQIAAVWTLICILAGGLITLVLVAVMGDRGDPGPDEEPEPEPDLPSADAWFRAAVEGEPLEPLFSGPPDPDRVLQSWLDENTTTASFEANLLPKGRG